MAASEPYKTGILLALHTGMRLGELMALNWEKVDFVKKQIVVKDNFSVGILGSTKGNRIRYIPMTRDLFDHLLSMVSKEGYVLKGPDGLRFRPECSRTSITRYVLKQNFVKSVGINLGTLLLPV